MNSRYLQLLAAGLIAVAPVLGPAAANGSLFRLSRGQEATIADIRAALTARDLTCRQLVQGHFDRIEAYDKKGPALNAIIMINPNALAAADALDTKFAQSTACR